MACCAFAVYLLTQLLWPLRWARDRVFGAPIPRANAAVAWSPATQSSPQRPAARRWRPLLIAVLAAEVAGLGVAVHAASVAPPPITADASLFTALHTSVCRAVRKSLS